MSSVLLQNHRLHDVLLPLDQLPQVHVPPINYLRWLVELSQIDLVLCLLDSVEELAGVVGVVGGQQVEEGRHLKSFDFVDVEGVGFDDRDVVGLVVSKVLGSDVVFGVNELLGSNLFETVVVDGRYLEVSVDALGDAGHLGVVVPVELLSRRDNYEEQGKFFLAFDRESNDAGGYLDFSHDFVELGEPDLVDFRTEKLEVVRFPEGFAVIIVVPVSDTLDEVEQILEGATFREQQLQLFEFLRLRPVFHAF